MKLLGLDNSKTCTGWAICVHKGRTDCGSFQCKGETHEEIFASYDAWLEELIAKHAATPEPIVGAAVEESLPGGRGKWVDAHDLAGGKKFVNPTNQETQLILFGLRSLALARLHRAGIPILRPSPQEWRRSIMPKGTAPPKLNAQGRGLSDKERSAWWKAKTAEQVRLLGIHVPQKITPTGRISSQFDDGAADASGIVLWARARFLESRYQQMAARPKQAALL